MKIKKKKRFLMRVLIIIGEKFIKKRYDNILKMNLTKKFRTWLFKLTKICYLSYVR